MAVNESIIRDKLSNSLELLEPGLTLLEIEKYLPNSQGTRGFVDILAKDSRGRYVLIELKRSDAASRQAIHEVLKYVEGSKINLAARDDELRIFIVSTEWNELLIPFSSFVERISLQTAGFKLTVSATGDPISADLVLPLPLVEGRLFIGQHQVDLYVSAASLAQGIKSYEATNSYKGIVDYVLISLIAHQDFREKEISSTAAAMQSMGLPPISKAELETKITQHSHMLYFAPLKMDDAICLEFIKHELQTSNQEELDEFLSYLDDIEDENNRSTEIHEKIFEIEPQPHRDYLEIGYPAKFMKILDDEKWEITEIRRYGAVKNNTLLNDKTIISEVRGEQGVTRQKYRKDFLGNDSKEINSIAADVADCLQDNPIWRNQLAICIPELVKIDKNSKSTISIFIPSNIIFSLFNYIARPDGDRYVPGYQIISEVNDFIQVIYGNIEITGKNPSMSMIVDKYYSGDPGMLLASLSWGGYEKNDALIVRDIGLTYSTYKFQEQNGCKNFWKLTELGWEPTEPVYVNQNLNKFIKENKYFIDDIHDFYSTHWNGFMVMYSRAGEIKFRT